MLGKVSLSDSNPPSMADAAFRTIAADQACTQLQSATISAHQKSGTYPPPYAPEARSFSTAPKPGERGRFASVGGMGNISPALAEKRRLLASWQQWAKAGYPDENRSEALARLKQNFRTRDNTLDLKGLGLRDLPKMPVWIEKLRIHDFDQDVIMTSGDHPGVLDPLGHLSPGIKQIEIKLLVRSGVSYIDLPERLARQDRERHWMPGQTQPSVKATHISSAPPPFHPAAARHDARAGTAKPSGPARHDPPRNTANPTGHEANHRARAGNDRPESNSETTDASNASSDFDSDEGWDDGFDALFG